MKIIFITISHLRHADERGIFPDLMRKFRNENHEVYIITPSERRFKELSGLIKNNGINYLLVRIPNIQKTDVIEKGISTLLVENLYVRSIKKHLSHLKFDLILYSTPPITFNDVVRYLKKENPRALSYLLLKDIFPQNAVDLGLFSQHSLFYWYFRRKEKALYKISDFIGCMSPANVEFVQKHNPYYPSEKIEVAPNSIEIKKTSLDSLFDPSAIRHKYGLPNDKPIFIYGGNLGRPQGIDYLIKCLDANKNRVDCFFVVVGNGTEYNKIASWYENAHPKSVKLMERLPKEDYDKLVNSCDVGLIFLDYRFTIPNFPSRWLVYLQYKMPVICATDTHTDIGKISVDNGFGFWCESINPDSFTALVDRMLLSDRKKMGERGNQFLMDNYQVEHTYKTIISHV